MLNTIYGKKLGMTQLWSEDDTVIPVTVIQADPNIVCQVKTPDGPDGYGAVQLSFGEIKPKHVTRPMKGHYDKFGVEPKRYLREVRTDDAADYKAGDEQTVEAFTDVAYVDVTGTSIGKGFQGVMKRYGFGGGPKTHGSHFHRAPGSVGQCASPSRVFKGARMPGRMGCDTVTVQNLKVVRVDPENNVIIVKGAVPGHKNSVVRVRVAKKTPKK